MSKTRIIATLGPASQDYRVLKNMALAGMSVARINFSHGSIQEKSERLSLLKKINRKLGNKIKILGDLEGYRIRIGKLKKPLKLEKGRIIYLTHQDIIGDKNLLPFDYTGDLKDIRKNEFIYVDDGNIELLVLGHQAKSLKLKVTIGGVIKSFKGINIPSGKLHFGGLSEKDKNDIIFCVKEEFDFIAQSFVRNAADILKVREVLTPYHARCQVIAKIENRQGFDNLDHILGVCDGIMVARGDLGVSLPIFQVPIYQKKIIRKCKKRDKFVITATQMLESMTDNLRPTRAEVSDVANAVLDGSDYVMLSGETAVGNYPVESIKMMEKIISFTQGNRGSL
jgi:pyruvate kinase